VGTLAPLPPTLPSHRGPRPAPPLPVNRARPADPALGADGDPASETSTHYCPGAQVGNARSRDHRRPPQPSSVSCCRPGPKQPTHGRSRDRLQPRRHMGVRVQRDPDLAMTEQVAHDLRTYALAEHPGRPARPGGSATGATGRGPGTPRSPGCPNGQAGHRRRVGDIPGTIWLPVPDSTIRLCQGLQRRETSRPQTDPLADNNRMRQGDGPFVNGGGMRHAPRNLPPCAARRR
jgi:hypothetical protein